VRTKGVLTPGSGCLLFFAQLNRQDFGELAGGDGDVLDVEVVVGDVDAGFFDDGEGGDVVLSGGELELEAAVGGGFGDGADGGVGCAGVRCERQGDVGDFLLVVDGQADDGRRVLDERDVTDGLSLSYGGGQLAFVGVDGGGSLLVVDGDVVGAGQDDGGVGAVVVGRGRVLFRGVVLDGAVGDEGDSNGFDAGGVVGGFASDGDGVVGDGEVDGGGDVGADGDLFEGGVVEVAGLGVADAGVEGVVAGGEVGVLVGAGGVGELVADGESAAGELRVGEGDVGVGFGFASVDFVVLVGVEVDGAFEASVQGLGEVLPEHVGFDVGFFGVEGEAVFDG